MTPWRPEYAVPPGHVLIREIEARGISQAELALRTGLSAKHINQIVKGVVPLSLETALLLERVLGIPSRIWTELDAAYRERTLRAEAQERLAGYADWASRFPAKILVDRGVIDESDDAGARTEKLLRFFAVASPDAFEAVWGRQLAALRAVHTFELDPYFTATWLRLAEVSVNPTEVCPFNDRGLKRILPELRRLTISSLDQSLPQLQDRCARVGVSVVLGMPSVDAPICSATRWIGGIHPVIVMCGNYRVEDSFWFSLFHEIGHLVLHPKRMTYIAPDINEEKNDIEKEADSYAENVLIPSAASNELKSLRSAADIQRFAYSLDVDSGIVAGRLVKEGKLNSPSAGLRRRMPLIKSNAGSAWTAAARIG